MRLFLIPILALLLASCAINGFQQFYKPYIQPEKLTNVKWLQSGEEPKVFGTNNFNEDIRTLRSKMYIPIGYSSFNGSLEDESMVKAQAERIGATIVLLHSQYKSTQTTTSPLFVPNSSTTYSSGSVYGGGIYGGYNGSSTTYGTTVVPITTQQQLYDQTAVYFVKSTQKLRFGINLLNLNEAQRHDLQRNTGAVIDVVIEGTPAFYANLLPGDILIKINGIAVRDASHALKLMHEINEDAKQAKFMVVRNNKEKEITIVLKDK